MDAATGDVSDAELARAEVVLLEADLAASTALDMSVLAEWRGGNEGVGLGRVGGVREEHRLGGWAIGNAFGGRGWGSVCR